MLKISVQQSIQATPENVFSWLENSENYRRSSLVFLSKWQSTDTGENAIRNLITIGGLFQEKVTTLQPNKLIQYDIQRSIPAIITKGTGKITINSNLDGTTLVNWQISLNLNWPLLTNIVRNVVTRLYSNILLTSARELEMTNN